MDTHADRNLSDIFPKTNPILGWARDDDHPHLGVIDERGEPWMCHLFKSGADYSQAGGPWARVGIRGKPRGSLHAHASEEVTGLVLFSLKEGGAHSFCVIK